MRLSTPAGTRVPGQGVQMVVTDIWVLSCCKDRQRRWLQQWRARWRVRVQMAIRNSLQPCWLCAALSCVRRQPPSWAQELLQTRDEEGATSWKVFVSSGRNVGRFSLCAEEVMLNTTYYYYYYYCYDYSDTPTTATMLFMFRVCLAGEYSPAMCIWIIGLYARPGSTPQPVK